MLEREGYMIMNHKKLYRLYTEEKAGRQATTWTQTGSWDRGHRCLKALRPGERWSLDFLSDTFGASRRFRILGGKRRLLP